MDPSQDNTQPNQGLDLSAVRSKNLPHEEKTGGPGQSAGGPADPNAVPVPALAFDVDEASFNDVVAISDRVPVVIDLQAEWSEQGKQLSPIVERIVESFGGRLVLARVDVDANPRLQQAFGVESIPNVIAIVKGQPVPLFQSALPEVQVKAYFDELLKLAGENGVTGHAVVAGAEQEPAGPAHPEAEEALNRETSIRPSLCSNRHWLRLRLTKRPSSVSLAPDWDAVSSTPIRSSSSPQQMRTPKTPRRPRQQPTQKSSAATRAAPSTA